MNRTALGLAVGAGYLLGRTKKLKMALAVGSLAAGKKLNLSPRALADQLNRQLRENPQFKEIGDQLRQDLRGVGKAATGAMAERQMNTLADRLHGRTNRLHDQLSGVVPSGRGGKADEEAEESEEPEDTEDTEDSGRAQGAKDTEGAKGAEAPRKKTGTKKAPAKKAPAPAGKAAARKKSTAGKTAAKKTAGAGAAARDAVSRQSKGGDDR